MTSPTVFFQLSVGLLFLACTSTVLHADWIRLKDGVQVHGRIIMETDERVTLKSRKGTYSFDTKRIAEIHRTSPKPKTEAEKKREEAERKKDAAPPPKLTINARETAFGPCRLVLPLGFALKKKRSKVGGYDGEILGVYQEKSTGALVSVASDTMLPLEARSLSELATAVEEHLKAEDGTEVVKVEQRSIDRKPSVVAEFIQVRGDQKLRHVQAWISDDRCYSVSIAVPDRKYRLNSLRYRKILESFERREVETKGKRRTSKPTP
ncbi:MAG: hypothetical protein AAF488_17970 [Planctomycetota bacterium]